MEFHNRLANEAASYGGEPQVASASINLGPRGGFQSGQISPVSLLDEIQTRTRLKRFCNILKTKRYTNNSINLSIVSK